MNVVAAKSEDYTTGPQRLPVAPSERFTVMASSGRMASYLEPAISAVFSECFGWECNTYAMAFVKWIDRDFM